MKIRTNLYLITAILLTSTFLTLCEGVNDIDHEPFSDHLDHLDHLDDFHDINNFDDSNVIHRVELVQHNGDSMTKYATTTHTNQETNNELFPNTIPIIQQSNVPTTFTKVVKQMVIKKSNNDGNNSPKNDLSMKDNIYSNNKLKESVIGTVENNGLPSIPSQQASDLQSNIKNIIHTTVTKTTTSGSPSNELNESFNRIHNLNALPSNNIISTMSSENTKYNDRNAGSSSSQSNSMDENSKIKTISTTEDITNGNGFGNSKLISRKPGGSFRRTKTTILKHSINDINDRGDLGTSSIGFNREDTSSNNIGSSMTAPLGYNTVTTTTVDRDNNVFNNGIPSRIQQIRFNKLNKLGNSISETGAVQNPGSFVQTKTTIIKNGRAADEIKLDDLNDNKIDYNIGDGMSTSNDIVNSNYIISSDNNGNDKSSGYGYSYGYGYGNGMDSGNYNNDGNYNSIYSNHLMDGASSGGYPSYIISNGYSKGNGKGKKRKKNGTKKTYKGLGGSSKNISYGKSRGNGQIKVKTGRNYENTRSSKNRSGGNSQYYSSTNYVRGGQSKSFSSSASSSDESSMKKKNSCHCNKERKLKKRDSSESNGSSEGHHGPGRPGSHDLGTSMEIQPMQNNGDFIAGVPPQLPPSMGREPHQLNLLFDMMQEQGPDQSLNYSQSDITKVLNRQGEMGSQLINDHQLPNTDISNQYLTYQIPNTGPLYKSDSQQEQYFGSPRLGPGPGPHQGHGPGPHPGHGPGPHPGHGPGPHPGHGPWPHPGHGPGPRSGHGPGPHPGNGPCPRPGHGPGPQANPFDSRPFIGGEYPKLFEQNLQPSPLQQFPYPYSFISNMGSTTPVFTDIQSGQEDQININTDLPQMQQDIEGTGFNRMDALNSGSMTTSTRSNMIRNTGGGPIIQYFKTIKTTENIDGNGPLDMQMVQTQSVPPEVDSYGNYIIL